MFDDSRNGFRNNERFPVVYWQLNEKILVSRNVIPNHACVLQLKKLKIK